MQIDLTTRETPTDKEHKGVFADVYQTPKKDKRERESNYLELVGELEETKSNGKRFTAIASYNLDNARGINSLKKMLKIWRDVTTLPDLSDFNPEEEFIGKGFKARPTVSGKGGKRVIQITSFKPDDTGKPLTVSKDFVRLKDAGKAQ
jgi:hypothetical protein